MRLAEMDGSTAIPVWVASREDELRACVRRAEELRYPRRVRIAIRSALTLVAAVSGTNAADQDEVRIVIREALDAFAAHELLRAR